MNFIQTNFCHSMNMKLNLYIKRALFSSRHVWFTIINRFLFWCVFPLLFCADRNDKLPRRQRAHISSSCARCRALTALPSYAALRANALNIPAVAMSTCAASSCPASWASAECRSMLSIASARCRCRSLSLSAWAGLSQNSGFFWKKFIFILLTPFWRTPRPWYAGEFYSSRRQKSWVDGWFGA